MSEMLKVYKHMGGERIDSEISRRSYELCPGDWRLLNELTDNSPIKVNLPDGNDRIAILKQRLADEEAKIKAENDAKAKAKEDFEALNEKAKAAELKAEKAINEKVEALKEQEQVKTHTIEELEAMELPDLRTYCDLVGVKHFRNSTAKSMIKKILENYDN